MVNCQAVGCTNTSVKGFVMCKFPKDNQRRKQWVIKTRRANWKPNDCSFLCEMHFDSDAWEKTRVDGRKKLKQTAVPTIFSYTKPSPRIAKRKPPKERQFVSSTTTKSKTSDAASQQTHNIESMCDTIIQCSDEVPEVALVIESCTSLYEEHSDSDTGKTIRVDGDNKLKQTALPTIIGFTEPAPNIVKRTPPKGRQVVSSSTTKSKTSDAESQQTNDRENMCDTIIQCSDEVPEVALVIESCTSLCEEYFNSDAWETIRVDGDNKLKQTALPTIISFTKPATNIVKRTLPKGRQFVSSATKKSKTSDAESQQANDRESQCDDASFQCSYEIPEVSQIVECFTTVSQDTENMQPFKDGDLKQSSAAQNAIQELKEKVERIKNMYENEFLRAEAFQKKCKDLAKELDKTKQSLAEKTDELLILKQVFKDDQMKLMKNRAKKQGDAEVALCHQWSNDTIAQAVRLRQSCGNAGYEQLIKAGFPFPSIRTLQRYVKS